MYFLFFAGRSLPRFSHGSQGGHLVECVHSHDVDDLPTLSRYWWGIAPPLTVVGRGVQHQLMNETSDVCITLQGFRYGAEDVKRCPYMMYTQVLLLVRQPSFPAKLCPFCTVLCLGCVLESMSTAHVCAYARECVILPGFLVVIDSEVIQSGAFIVHTHTWSQAWRSRHPCSPHRFPLLVFPLELLVTSDAVTIVTLSDVTGSRWRRNLTGDKQNLTVL
jgi:hypothetical protein